MAAATSPYNTWSPGQKACSELKMGRITSALYIDTSTYHGSRLVHRSMPR
jgi:hypothetical protein